MDLPLVPNTVPLANQFDTPADSAISVSLSHIQKSTFNHYFRTQSSSASSNKLLLAAKSPRPGAPTSIDLPPTYSTSSWFENNSPFYYCSAKSTDSDDRSSFFDEVFDGTLSPQVEPDFVDSPFLGTLLSEPPQIPSYTGVLDTDSEINPPINTSVEAERAWFNLENMARLAQTRPSVEGDPMDIDSVRTMRKRPRPIEVAATPDARMITPAVGIPQKSSHTRRKSGTSMRPRRAGRRNILQSPFTSPTRRNSHGRDTGEDARDLAPNKRICAGTCDLPESPERPTEAAVETDEATICEEESKAGDTTSELEVTPERVDLPQQPKRETSPQASPKEPPVEDSDSCTDWPDQADLTWKTDEITGHDFDPNDPDDYVGMDGVAFEPTPQRAPVLARLKKAQLDSYRKAIDREARANRRNRRWQDSGNDGDVSGRKKVRFAIGPSE